MTPNPLFELILWTYESANRITYRSILECILHAPEQYDIWWRHLFRESPQHILIETGLILFILWLIFIRRTVDPGKTVKNEKLTKREIEWLLDTWRPDSLVPVLSPTDNNVYEKNLVVDSVSERHVNLLGINQPVLNVSSFDFLGFSHNGNVKKSARDALDFYGCGSCGPRGFYGTIDQHLYFEDAIANFMGTEEAICYSDGASSVSSAIPAFCKKGDLLLVDEACSEPILTGCNLSRSTVHYFKHNDMHNLRCILESIADDDKKLKRDTLQQRRFIIVEGLYRNTGDICPLTEIMRLKEEFCYRLILDESLSFGTLGNTGRGITEHFSVKISDVEVIVFTLDTTLASVGGVCIGSREIVDHQRLSGAGYCFSASAPPFLSAVASCSLKLMIENPSMLKSLRNNSAFMYDKLKQITSLKLLSVNVSPVFCLVLSSDLGSVEEESEVLLKATQLCIEKGLGVTVSKFALVKRRKPWITLSINVMLTEKDMSKAAEVLAKSISACIN